MVLMREFTHIKTRRHAIVYQIAEGNLRKLLTYARRCESNYSVIHDQIFHGTTYSDANFPYAVVY
jgi:hypothetical protein